MNTTIRTLASFAILSPMANAALVGLNFQGDGVANLVAGTTAGSTAGTIAPQQNWNNALNQNGVVGTIADLVSSTGSSSGIAASFVGPDSWRASNVPGPIGVSGNEQMSYGFIKAQNITSATVTFSGLMSGTLFDMVIYTATDEFNITGTFALNDTLNTSVSYVVGSGNTATFTESSTKHMFTNLTAVNNSVTLTMSGGGAGLAGVQFSASAVPEPSSAVLFGLGALGLLTHRTRRRA